MTEINKHIQKAVAEGIIDRLSHQIKDYENDGQDISELASWDNKLGCLIDLRDAKNIIVFLQKFV